jgi:hypothetical protein
MLACSSPRVSLKFVGSVCEWLSFIPLETFGRIQEQHYLLLWFSGLEHIWLWIQSPPSIIIFRFSISSWFKRTRLCICRILWMSLRHSNVQTKNNPVISLNLFYFCKISSNILSFISHFSYFRLLTTSGNLSLKFIYFVLFQELTLAFVHLLCGFSLPF